MSLSHLHIVHADDDSEDRFIFRDCLFEVDNSVELTQLEDGHSLLAHLASLEDPLSHPCVIVSDMKMPLTGGIEVLRIIRNHPKWNHVPVVILTTSSTDYDREMAINLGATAFYSKPGSYAEVEQLAKKIIAIGQEACGKEEALAG